MKKILAFTIAVAIMLSFTVFATANLSRPQNGTYRSVDELTGGWLEQVWTFSGTNEIELSIAGGLIATRGTYTIDGNRLLITSELFGVETVTGYTISNITSDSFVIDGVRFHRETGGALGTDIPPAPLPPPDDPVPAPEPAPSDPAPPPVSAAREIRFFSTIGNREGSVMLPWGEGLFDQGADHFNPDLANAAMALSLAAYDRHRWEGLPVSAIPYDLRAVPPGAYIHFSLNSLGFDLDSIRLHNYLLMDGGHNERWPHEDPDQNHNVGYAFARQSIVDSRGGRYELVAIVVRGTQGNYGVEWFSNFDVLDPGNIGAARSDHYGFSVAARQLRVSLDNYMADNNLSRGDNIKFLVTGHSRGGAVANLLAYELSTDNRYASPDNVYAYTFATPNPVKMSEINSRGDVSNIFNFVNAEDFVPYSPFPVEGWDFWKWGQTFAFPSKNVVNDSIFEASYSRMNELFRGFTGGISHIRFTSRRDLLERRDGYTEVQRLVRNARDLAASPRAFHDSRHGNKTLRDFFREMVADALTMPESSAVEMARTAAGFINMAFVPILDFFVAHHVPELFPGGGSTVMHAHAPETYLAWMMAADFNDMRTNFRGEANPAGPPHTAYLQARISCPVDVEVFDSRGNLVGVISNNAVSGVFSESAAFFVDGDVKDIYLPLPDEYTFRLVGSDYGTMDFLMESVDPLTGRLIEARQFADVELFDGKEFVSEVGFDSVAEAALFVVEGGEVIAEVLADGSEVPVTVDGPGSNALLIAAVAAALALVLVVVIVLTKRGKGKKGRAPRDQAQPEYHGGYHQPRPAQDFHHHGQEKVAFCGKCGSRFSGDDIFCRVCGERRKL